MLHQDSTYDEERHGSFLSIGTYSLEMTKRGGVGPFAAAAATLPGDDEEGSDNGSNTDAADNVVLSEHSAGFWLYCWMLRWMLEKVSSPRMRYVACRMIIKDHPVFSE